MSESEAATALGEVDPKKISREEFASQLEQAVAGGQSLSALRPDQFARLISRASASQLDSIMTPRHLREAVVDEVFRRMSAHYKADKARNTEAVVRWRIGTATGADNGDTEADSGDYLRYECLLSGGTCTVSRQLEHEPRVTIMVGPVDFLKLTSGSSSAPTMFLTGKLKVAGDVGFAAGLTKLFQIPQA